MSEVLYGDKDFVLTSEEVEGQTFVHLSIASWSKSVLQRIKAVFTATLAYYEVMGKDVIFATSDSAKSVKLWQIVKPCDELVELKQGKLQAGWLGAWYTGEE